MNKSYEVRIKIYDAMGIMTTRYTRYYQSLQDAHRAAYRLTRQYYGNTGRDRIVEEYRVI